MAPDDESMVTLGNGKRPMTRKRRQRSSSSKNPSLSSTSSAPYKESTNTATTTAKEVGESHSCGPMEERGPHTAAPLHLRNPEIREPIEEARIRLRRRQRRRSKRTEVPPPATTATAIHTTKDLTTTGKQSSDTKEEQEEEEAVDSLQLNGLSNLRKSCQLADKAVQDAREASESLQSVAKKWRSHRQKLSRDATLQALNKLAALSTPKDNPPPSETKTSDSGVDTIAVKKKTQDGPPAAETKASNDGVGKSTSTPTRETQGGPPPSESNTSTRDDADPSSTTTKEIPKDARKITMTTDVTVVSISDARWFREEKKVASDTETEPQEQTKVIVPSSQVLSLQEALVNEIEISDKLRNVRMILLKRTQMQEQRILELEAKLARQVQSTERAPAIEHTPQDIEDKKQRPPSTSPESKEAGRGSNILSILDDISSEHTTNGGNILALLENNSHDDSIYFDGDDTLSEISRRTTDDSKSSISTTDVHHPPVREDGRQQSRETHDVPKNENASIRSIPLFDSQSSGSIHSNSRVGHCACQARLITSTKSDDIEFYLPRLNFSCRCGRHQPATCLLKESTGLIALVLRPWQREFLSSAKGISYIQEFVSAYETTAGQLAIEMMQWRRQKGLHHMPQTSCSIALLIWSRTCVVAMRVQSAKNS